MDPITANIIAYITRENARRRCEDICGGFECYGRCLPLVLPMLQQQGSAQASPEQTTAPPTPVSSEKTPSDAKENLVFPIVVFTPADLFMNGDPAAGFRPRTSGRAGTATWPGLIRMLSRASEGDVHRYADPNVQKAARGGWAASSLKDGRRLASAFIETQLLGLDIDTNGDIEAALKAFAPFKKIVHTTYKSTPEAPRCRVLLVLKEPCRDAERFRHAHRAVRHAVVRAGWFKPEDFDDAGSDPSRLWYLPMVPPGASYVFHVTDGALLDASKLASSSVTSSARKRAGTTSSENRKSSPSAALAWAARRMAETAEGRRHTTVFSLAAWLAEIPDIDEDDIHTALGAVAPEGHEAEFERTIADGIRRGRGRAA